MFISSLFRTVTDVSLNFKSTRSITDSFIFGDTDPSDQCWRYFANQISLKNIFEYLGVHLYVHSVNLCQLLEHVDLCNSTKVPGSFTMWNTFWHPRFGTVTVLLVATFRSTIDYYFGRCGKIIPIAQELIDIYNEQPTT